MIATNEGTHDGRAKGAPAAADFRLLRYFTAVSLPAVLLVAAALLYFETREGDFFRQVQDEQSAFFTQIQDRFARQYDAAARRDLLQVHEAGNVNLARVFANALSDEYFALFAARAQRIPVDRCRAMADVKGAGGRSVQPDEKKACYAGIGARIMAFPEFRALDAKVREMMRKSTVFKIKVFDLRGITVYSSEHAQLGEDKRDNEGWRSAAGGRPASELTHRDTFSAFEGVVENRDLISSYLPVRARGGEKITGVFEIYSDVTLFLAQINAASAQIRLAGAENQARVERAAAENQRKVDESGNLRIAIVLAPLALLYAALLLVVGNGQRIIRRRDFERAQAARRLHLQSTALEAAANAIVITDRDGCIRWANPAFSALTGYAAEEAIGRNPRELIRSGQHDEPFYREMWETVLAGRVWQGDVVNRRKDGTLYVEEMTITPVLGEAGDITEFIAVKLDVTKRRRAAIALARQKDLYDMLSQTNGAIIRVTNRDELFQAVCRNAVAHGRFLFAWIGLVEGEDKRVRPVASYGDDGNYLEGLTAKADALAAAGRDPPSRQLLHSGQRVVINDFFADPATAPMYEAARRIGVQAMAKFPIRHGGAVIGIISIYAGERGFFTEDLLATLDEIATDVEFALYNFAREAARVRAEDALRQSDLQQQALIASVDGIVWEADAVTFQFLFVSPQAESMLGYPVQRWTSEPTFWRDHIHPGDRDWAVGYCTDAARDMKPHRFEYRFIAADGRSVWLNDIVSVIVKGGKPVKLRGLMVDVTERKRAEELLRAAEEQFRGLVEQSIAGIYIIQDGKLAYVNPRFAGILGYASADELTGRDPLSLVAEPDREMVAANLSRGLDGDVQSLDYSFAGVRKDGSTTELGLHGARATYRGQPAIIGMLQDVSEKRRAEQQIQRHVEQLQNAFMQVVKIATTLSEMRDPYTAGHERRVAEIAAAIGAELGFDARRTEGLRVAGYLHDIGKITIPAEILSKPGKLTPIEFALVKGHAQSGCDVLQGIEFPWPVAEIVLQHHERLDGSGYPNGLKGEAILLEARILAVADTIEAMASHRPYRPGLGIDRALAEIERGRDIVYDAQVADTCLRLFRGKGYAIPA